MGRRAAPLLQRERFKPGFVFSRLIWGQVGQATAPPATARTLPSSGVRYEPQLRSFEGSLVDDLAGVLEDVGPNPHEARERSSWHRFFHSQRG
jgi:hypothetical protein